MPTSARMLPAAARAPAETLPTLTAAPPPLREGPPGCARVPWDDPAASPRMLRDAPRPLNAPVWEPRTRGCRERLRPWRLSWHSPESLVQPGNFIVGQDHILRAVVNRRPGGLLTRP